MRLIDADFLKEWVDEYLSVFKKYDKGTIKGFVDHAPTIEPKRGEWVKRTHDTLIAQVNFAYCSECGQPIMHEHTRPLWNFCPNCGARMRPRLQGKHFDSIIIDESAMKGADDE